jgi:hypothetical protein
VALVAAGVLRRCRGEVGTPLHRDSIPAADLLDPIGEATLKLAEFRGTGGLSAQDQAFGCGPHAAGSSTEVDHQATITVELRLDPARLMSEVAGELLQIPIGPASHHKSL